MFFNSTLQRAGREDAAAAEGADRLGPARLQDPWIAHELEAAGARMFIPSAAGGLGLAAAVPRHLMDESGLAVRELAGVEREVFGHAFLLPCRVTRREGMSMRRWR